MHEGINVGKEGFYDPNAGLKKKKAKKPVYEGYPVLATDPGQPKVMLAAIGRNEHIDKSLPSVVESKPTGRRRKKADDGNTEQTSGAGESS